MRKKFESRFGSPEALLDALSNPKKLWTNYRGSTNDYVLIIDESINVSSSIILSYLRDENEFYLSLNGWLGDQKGESAEDRTSYYPLGKPELYLDWVDMHDGDYEPAFSFVSPEMAYKIVKEFLQHPDRLPDCIMWIDYEHAGERPRGY